MNIHRTGRCRRRFKSISIRVFVVPLLLMLMLVSGSFGGIARAEKTFCTVTDDLGRRVVFSVAPRRVVCLFGGVTDMVVELGRAEILAGLTRQDLLSHAALRTASMGGFFKPDPAAIAAVGPDLIIADVSQHALLRPWIDNPRSGARVLLFREGSLEKGFARMVTIGRLVGREARAGQIVARNREQIETVKARLRHLPVGERKRVARVVAGEGRLFCPGDDSFQNEMIAAAGGIPPQWGKTGGFAAVDVAAWQAFNPQMVYGCGNNMDAVGKLLEGGGWGGIAAAADHSITSLPCAITCRVTPRTGAAVQWLAAYLYPALMADVTKAVTPNCVRDERPLNLDLPYVASVGVVTHRVNDADLKSLVVRFKTPQAILSTAEGNQGPVQAVGNTYTPEHAAHCHMAFGMEQARRDVAANLGYTTQTYAGLGTAADMDNLSVQVQREGGLEVAALVTAGTRGNAQRMSRDIGYAQAAGTINIILLTNRKLAPEGMARAIITATEAKTAALLDLDIRSTQDPWPSQATGTGTDSMIVVQGEGRLVRYTGGHGKIGELIARAVHAGVTEALVGQNGIRSGRNVLQRLDERKLSLEDLARLFPSGLPPGELERRLERALEDPAVAGFVEVALAVSDAAVDGRIADLGFFEQMCRSMGAQLSGRGDFTVTEKDLPDRLTPVMARALGTLAAAVSADSSQLAGR